MFYNIYAQNRNIRFIISNILWILVSAYFIYHLFNGGRGAISWSAKNKEIKILENELNHLESENDFLENKIARLRESNLDLDLLEEVAHDILGLVNDNDIVVLLPK